MKLKKYIRLFIGIIVLFSTYGFIKTIYSDSVFISSATLEPKKSIGGNSSSSPFASLGSGISSSLFSNTGKSDDVVLALELIRSKDFFEELLSQDDFVNKLNKPLRTNYIKTYTKEPASEMLTFDNMHSRFLNNHLSFTRAEKTGIVTIRISHYEAQTAKEWLDIIILKLNLRIRDIRVSESKKIVDFLQIELSKQSVSEIRFSLSSLMAQEIRTIALSGLDNEFVFKIVDKPRVPNKRARPSRALNIITWFIFSIVTSSMCVLGLHRLSIHRKWM